MTKNPKRDERDPHPLSVYGEGFAGAEVGGFKELIIGGKRVKAADVAKQFELAGRYRERRVAGFARLSIAAADAERLDCLKRLEKAIVESRRLNMVAIRSFLDVVCLELVLKAKRTTRSRRSPKRRPKARATKRARA